MEAGGKYVFRRWGEEKGWEHDGIEATVSMCFPRQSSERSVNLLIRFQVLPMSGQARNSVEADVAEDIDKITQ